MTVRDTRGYFDPGGGGKYFVKRRSKGAREAEWNGWNWKDEICQTLELFFHYVGRDPTDFAGTDPTVGGGIHDRTSPSSAPEIPRFDGGDPSDFVATDPFVGRGIHEGIGTADYPEIPDPSLGGEIHSTFDGTEAFGSLPVYASPPRHVVDKGHVYTRRPTPQKIESTQENLASMVDAVVDAASAMETSHTEAPAAGVVPAPPRFDHH